MNKQMFFTKRTLIYTAFGNEKYLKMAGKLTSAGISFKTKSRNNNRIIGGPNIFPVSFMDKSTQYDIYVKKEDEYKAYQAIHKD